MSFHPETIQCAYPVIKETVPQSERGYRTNNKYHWFQLTELILAFHFTRVAH